MISPFSCYMCLQQLPENVKWDNKIMPSLLTPRFDAIAMAGYCKALEELKNDKDMLFFYLQQTRGIINSPNRRRADYFLQCSKESIHFSSIYTLGETSTGNIVGFGEPNRDKDLKNGKPNPFYDERNDGYLFLISKDYKQIEVLIIPDGRYTIRGNAQQLRNGCFDEVLKSLRVTAQPMYDYLNNGYYSNLFPLPKDGK